MPSTPSIFEDIHEFHTQVLKLEVQAPSLVSQAFMLERVRFLQEETAEFTDAALTGDIVAATDGLIDIIYVAAGTLWAMGVPSQECWNAVHKANMAKVLGTTSRGNKVDAAKPPGWVAPEADIAAAIDWAAEAFYVQASKGDTK